MRRALTVFVVFFLFAVPVLAIRISPFVSTDLFVHNMQDIVIAKCTRAFPDQEGGDGLYAVDVDITRVLKGTKKAGKGKIATIYPMEEGNIYLLSSLGGSALGTDFLAIPELSVVEVPSHFDFERLRGKTVRDQVQAIFDARLAIVKRKLRTLHEEKYLLDRATKR